MEKVKKISISIAGLRSKLVELYYLGYFDEKDLDRCVTVVGSRKMTEYGKQVIKKMIPTLVESGKIIVSGLMYGVDQTVHRECITCGGRTIAVLGWGLTWDGVGAAENRLVQEIVNSGGAVISEWLDQRSKLWMFPHRDRTMAAMSTDVYVVEGAMKSGSLITAEWGWKLGKQVWAVPGPVTSRVSEGTNWLIASGRAEMWLPRHQLKIGTGVKNNDKIESDIYILLQSEPLTIDVIALKLGRSVERIGAEISMLEIGGDVEERGGKYYIVE